MGGTFKVAPAKKIASAKADCGFKHNQERIEKAIYEAMLFYHYSVAKKLTKEKGSDKLSKMFERIFNSTGTLEHQINRSADELYLLVTGTGDYWYYRRYLHAEVKGEI